MDVDCSRYENRGYRIKRDASNFNATTLVVTNLTSYGDNDEEGSNTKVTISPHEGCPFYISFTVVILILFHIH